MKRRTQKQHGKIDPYYHTATVWRWAKSRAAAVLARYGLEPIRPIDCDAFAVNSDPAQIARANLSQWFVPACSRRYPGVPKYRASSVVAFTLRFAHADKRRARLAVRREIAQSRILAEDLRAAAKMWPHIVAIHSAGLPVEILVVPRRLHRERESDDGTMVQIIVTNTARIANLVHRRLGAVGIPAMPPIAVYAGQRMVIVGPDEPMVIVTI